MTRIDMTTREWHELVKPVLPHTINDKDFPELDVVRLEVGEMALYAVATDRYTIAAERLMDLLQAHGIIGPADGSKARDVLVGSEASGAALAALRDGIDLATGERLDGASDDQGLPV